MFMKDFTRSATVFKLRRGPAAHRVAAPVSAAPVSDGFLASTLVETASGWRAAGTLAIGDRVQTLDGGLARVAGIGRTPVSAAHRTEAIVVPGGLLDTCRDLWLLPDQMLLIDTAGDEGLPDEAMVLVPAHALSVLPAVRRPVLNGGEIVTLMFAQDEVIWANSGALLHCAGSTGAEDDFFTRLDPASARAFLARCGGARLRA